MEARELRINNIVMLDETKPVRILWFKLEVACIMEVGKDYPSAIVRLERLSGLPLNEEWSLKLGFEKKPHTWKDGSVSNRILIKKPFFIGLYPEFGFNTLSMFHNYFEQILIPSDLKYIHQLQNLLFDLKNEELALNHETN